MLFTMLNALVWFLTLVLVLCIRPFAADRTTWMILVIITIGACVANIGQLFRSKPRSK